MEKFRMIIGYWQKLSGCLGVVVLCLVVPLLYVAVGAVFAAFSLPEGTAKLTARDGWASLRWLADASAAVNGALPAYPLLLTCLIWATGVFLLAVLALAVRHREPAFAVTALLMTPLAAAGLHAVAWAYTAVHWLVRTIGLWVGGWDWWVWVILVALAVLSWIALFSGGAKFVSVLGGVGWVVVGNVLLIGLILLLSKFTFVIPYLLLLLALGVLFVLGHLVVGTMRAGRGHRGVLLGTLGLGTVLLMGLILLIKLTFAIPFWPLLLALGVLYLLGLLVVDQLTGTMKAGRRHRGVLLGTLGVGTSWSMLMVVGNVGGSHALYPQVARDWVANTLMGNNPPQFDTFMALVVVVGSALSVLANVHRMREEPTPEQVRRSFLFTFFSMVFAALIAAIGHRSETGGNRQGRPAAGAAMAMPITTVTAPPHHSQATLHHGLARTSNTEVGLDHHQSTRARDSDQPDAGAHVAGTCNSGAFCW